jgi:hypothetical protein
MSRSSPALDELQHWVLTAITSPAEPNPEELKHLILQSSQQTSVERLAVYRQAYMARLLGVLRELFPCTRFAVGDELFDQFCVGYLRAHPPTSYTLGRLADRLPEYLDATRPADWGGFIVELTRLEQAIDRGFDAPGPERLPPLRLPNGICGKGRLRLTPGCELLSFKYPVSTYYTAWKSDHAAGWPNPLEQYIALVRRDYMVRRYDLHAAQFRVLSALQAGASLDEAVSLAADMPGGRLDDLPSCVQQWFHDWTSAGFFVAAD